jgi:dTDP-4-dehydrorhamnose reductase
MRAIVIGASGFIGQHLMAQLGPNRAIGTYHRHPFPGGLPFDTISDSIGTFLSRQDAGLSHAFVLHGAIDTEACARDPARTAAINVDSVWRVMRGLLNAGLVPVYISTDYVFDGSHGGWRETDHAEPNTQYGMQKLEVEKRLAADSRPWLIVRLSRVVGTELGTHSVLGPWIEQIRAGDTMRCATDQIFSPASVVDVAGALIKLTDSGATGLFHLGGPEPFSRIGLLRLLVKTIQTLSPDVDADIVPCSLHDLPFTEKRPLDTSIAIDKFQHAIGWSFTPMAAICAELAARHFGGDGGHVG